MPRAQRDIDQARVGHTDADLHLEFDLTKNGLVGAHHSVAL